MFGNTRPYSGSTPSEIFSFFLPDTLVKTLRLVTDASASPLARLILRLVVDTNTRPSARLFPIRTRLIALGNDSTQLNKEKKKKSTYSRIAGKVGLYAFLSALCLVILSDALIF